MSTDKQKERRPRWLWRMVRLFSIYARDGGCGLWLPIYRSMNEPPENGEDGWQRWELVFVHMRRSTLSQRGQLGSEPAFYRWRYDGRVRWRLWITPSYFASWGRDYTDLPNTEASERGQ
jgi:hypothetical protein